MKFSISDNMKFSADIRDMKFGINVGYVQPKNGVGQAVDSAVSGNAKIGVLANSVLLPWIYSQQTDDDARTTATLTVKPAADCLLVAAVMSRSEASVSGEDWTKITSGTATLSQRITVWYKKVSAGTHTVTVTQTDSARMSLKLLCIYNAESLTAVDNTVASSVPIVPTATTTKRRLYLLSSAYASTAGTPVAISATDNSAELEAAEELRFSAFYDDEPESGITPEFTFYDSSYTADSINMLTLDIEEESE